MPPYQTAVIMSARALPGRIAFLGGHTPRRCGIATFTHDLCEAVGGVVPTAQCFAGAVNDRMNNYNSPPPCAL